MQTELVNHYSAMPSTKVTAAGIGGAIVTVAVAVAENIGWNIQDASLIAALTTLVNVGLAYLVKDRVPTIYQK
jgi:hypothetical protein